MKKKKIAITLERGMIVRNLVNTGFLVELKKSYEVVVVTPIPEDKRLLEHLGDNIEIERLHQHNYSKLEEWFVGIYKSLIYNETVKIKSRYGFQHKSAGGSVEAFRFWSVYIIFGLVLSKIKPLRSFWRFLDSVFFTKDYYVELFKKHQIDLVFVSNIHWRHEAYFLKSAKKRNIPTLGMTKSWDNFSKDGYRCKVDKLLVWNEFMRDEACEFQGYSKEEISVTGVPQFDLYKDTKTYAREELVRLYNLDADKKIILFGQESKFLSPDDKHIVALIADWIKREERPYQILIRPHFAHPESVHEFDHLVDNRTVYIDTHNEPSNFKDNWDFSKEKDKRLALQMIHSDIVITSISTLILDAIAAGTEVTTYRFDNNENIEKKDSIERLYEVLWFKELLKCGLGEIAMKSKEQFLDRIEGVLDGTLHTSADTINSISKRFLHEIDGNSTQRLHQAVTKFADVA